MIPLMTSGKGKTTKTEIHQWLLGSGGGSDHKREEGYLRGG